jgi:Ser/Thr protein kinase RdoA (MazF antagonist)
LSEEAAREAGAEIARELGLQGAPKVLQRSRHLFLLLRGDDVVIRVTPQRERTEADAAREFAVLRHLSAKGAPVVPPRFDLASDPHLRNGFVVTLWPYVPHEEADYDDQTLLERSAEALRGVHDAMADCTAALPCYLERIDCCAALLNDPSRLQTLAEADRRLVAEIHSDVRKRLTTRQTSRTPIHGDAHLGNVFVTRKGPLWTDFETACLGPREWDVCGAPHPPAFEPIDHPLYQLLSVLRSVCVVVWCMDLAGMPEKRRAGEHHLSLLKQRADRL